jgi:ribonucleoside-diphosphate reductase alpha chain
MQKSNSRKPLPNFRPGFSIEVEISNTKFVMTTGEYEDGSLGEVFIQLQKEGSDLQTILANFAISISLGLQYGVPLERFIESFKDVEFNPKGDIVGHETITEARSIMDFVFRELEQSYIHNKQKKSA